MGKLASGVGAQTAVTGLTFGAGGRFSFADIKVTINEALPSSLTIDVAHEGNHVANDQDAYGVWAITGNRQTAVNSPFNLTRYDDENQAYHVGAYVAEGIGRSDLTQTYGGGSYQIWRRGMQNVDQQVLDSLLRQAAIYNVTRTGQPGPGPRIIP
jgi:hypothetical protein